MPTNKIERANRRAASPLSAGSLFGRAVRAASRACRTTADPRCLGRLARFSPPKQVVTEWAAAFDRHDDAAAAALYHDDATNIQVPWGEPVRGRQAMLDAFTAILRAFPDSHSEIEHTFEDGEWVITRLYRR